MYKIIGNDGKAYGPVPADQIRQWILQGRVENRTLVLPTGAADWIFLGLLPEFAPNFPGPPPVIQPQKNSAVPVKNANGFATAGFVCGVISCICCCGCPFNIIGLIFSIIALVQIGAQVDKQNGWGLALAGLICSAVSLLINFGLWFFQFALAPANLSWHLSGI